MIRRLHVCGYKSLLDATIDLDRLSVIAGPNGAGKSNLLDLLHLLSRVVSRETLREAFEGHRGRPREAFFAPHGFGAGSADAIEKDHFFTVVCDLDISPSVVNEVNATLQEREHIQDTATSYTRVTERHLRYTLSIGIRARTADLFVADERLEALRKDGTPKSPTARPPFIERKGVGGNQRFVARIERQSHPRYFEPNRPRTLLSELSDPVYHPHVVAAAREMSSWRVYYVEPDRVRETLGVQSADEPGRHGELLAAYLHTLQHREPVTFRGLVKTLASLVPGLRSLRVDIREGSLEIIATNASGAEFPASLLSEGTLRLMCLLGIAVSPKPPGLVVYEEPENGVNPNRIDVVVDVVSRASLSRSGGPQFLLTTHSPLVCQLLSQHLIGCSWSETQGTRFRALQLASDDLFFGSSVNAVLDGLDESGRP